MKLRSAVRSLAALLVLALVIPVLVPACGPASAPPGQSAPIVTTTGMIADAARRIAGDRMEVRSLMGEGVDPHLYKASPGDVALLSGARLVLYNGLHLEGRMGDVLHAMAKSRPVVAVAEGIDPSRLRRPPEFEGQYDPHVWFDIELWSEAVGNVRDAIVAADPAGKEAYEAGASAYLAELDALHRWTKERISAIPQDRRVLVTAHDAFGYFGRAYGLEVHGVQGISTDSEASVRDINALVDLLVERRVPAVFIETSVPEKTVRALVEGCRSRGHSIAVGESLYSDAMGADGTPESTYIGMVRHNVEAVVRGLTGAGTAGATP